MKKKKKIFKTSKVLEDAVWITGCARSGTTILGKIISSLKNIEYAYEPETLFYLLPLISKIKKKYWQEIYSKYMIEEIFFNLCVGRKINLKKNDQSSIYNFLSKTDIEKKLNLNLRRKDLEKYLSKNNKKLVIKIPDVLHSLVFLQKYYPKNKIIVIKRDKKAIMSSLIKKKWFSKKNFSPDIYKNENWIDLKSYTKWIKLNENERASFYVDYINSSSNKIKNKLVVQYEDLVRDPKKTVIKICKFLKLKKTKKTLDIIDQIYIK